jgi:hypothetical protein
MSTSRSRPPKPPPLVIQPAPCLACGGPVQTEQGVEALCCFACADEFAAVQEKQPWLSVYDFIERKAGKSSDGSAAVEVGP